MSPAGGTAALSQRLDQALVWLVQTTQRTWDTLARSASGEGFGGSNAVASDPGPAVVLMAGGLTTLGAMMTFFMARRTLSSTPDPVNTRQSKKKAEESVDVYVSGAEPEQDREAEGADGEPSAFDGSMSSGSDPPDGTRRVVTASPTTGHDRGSTLADDVDGDGLETAEVEVLDRSSTEDGSHASRASGSRAQIFDRGLGAGQRVDADDPAMVLDRIRETDLGDPTVVHDTPNLYEIRLDDCRGCRSGPDRTESTAVEAGCPFEAGFLEGAMSRFTPGGVVVRETACRRWGDEACVFEIWY